MIVRALIIFVLLICCERMAGQSSEPQKSPVYTVEQMISTCRGIADIKIGNTGDVRMRDNADNGICWGFFSTFPIVISATYNMHYGTGRDFPWRVCLNGRGVTINQVIAVFMDYAKRHPERYTEDAFIVGMRAMQAAFPCVVKP